MTARLHKPTPKFAVRWQYPLFVVDDSLDPNDLKQAIGRPKACTDDQLLSLIKGKSLRAGQWQEQASEEYGISRSLFYNMISSMERRGLAKKIGGLWTTIP